MRDVQRLCAAVAASLLLGACAAPAGVRRVEFVRPASFERDGVVVCAYRKESGHLRCMTPEDAYLIVSEGKR